MKQSQGIQKSKAEVIIVGAGPVGLLTALRLGQAGIDTLVIESHDGLLRTSRAVVYMPVVLPVLRKLGIFDAVAGNAYLNNDGIAWHDIEGTPLAKLPLSSSDPDEFSGVLQLPQSRLNDIILQQLAKYPCVQVRLNCKCLSLNDDAASSVVTLTTQDPRNPEAADDVLEGRLILATDGARSTVRQLAGVGFEGFTYPFKMIGTDVVYDFEAHEAFNPIEFVVDPEDWAVIVFTGQDEHGRSPSSPEFDSQAPQWRIAYVEDADLPDTKDAIWQRAEGRIRKHCRSGHTWKLLRAEPYLMNQRCASQAMVGRVCFAGDALHSNNPIGGLGLTGGILDAFCYGNALIRALRPTPSRQDPKSNEAKLDHAILRECAESRLKAWQTITNGLSQTNLARLSEFDEEAVKRREDFFAKLNDESTRDGLAKMMRQGFDKMMEHSFEDGTAIHIS